MLLTQSGTGALTASKRDTAHRHLSVMSSSSGTVESNVSLSPFGACGSDTMVAQEDEWGVIDGKQENFTGKPTGTFRSRQTSQNYTLFFRLSFLVMHLFKLSSPGKDLD